MFPAGLLRHERSAILQLLDPRLLLPLQPHQPPAAAELAAGQHQRHRPHQQHQRLPPELLSLRGQRARLRGYLHGIAREDIQNLRTRPHLGCCY